MKLGRKPPRRTLRGLRSALVMARALDPLGSPPDASNDYTAAVTVPWGMMMNDELGCCVCSDTGHGLMLRTANNGSGQIVVPTDQDIVNLYEVVGGYVPSQPNSDQGCDETSMCEYLEKTGFLGHKSDGTGTVDPTDLDHLKWCIQLFGSCRIGVNLPQSAMDQFQAGQPWTVGGDGTILGGHDVPLVKYEGDTFYCITWGTLQPVMSDWIMQYNEEAHAELFFDWIAAQGTAPSGFDLEDLAAKMADLS